MSYVIAKKANKVGSIALKMKHGPELVRLKNELIDKVGLDYVELVTISRPSAYVEYEPYEFVHDEDVFKNAIFAMVDEIKNCPIKSKN